MKIIKSAKIEAEKISKTAKALVYFNLSKASTDHDKKMMYLYKSLNNAEMARRMLSFLKGQEPNTRALPFSR